MEYKIVKVECDDDSLLHISEILQQSFPKSKKFTKAYLKWQYIDNPIGEIVGFNAFYGDCLAAHYVTMPITMVLFGREVKGLISLNTATHPDHRGKGLFTILAKTTYDYAKENGFEFVTGVANANSTHGFLNKLGFYLISPLDVRLGFGNKIQNTEKTLCYRNWDYESLNWRLKNPTNKYWKIKDSLFSSIGPVGVKALIGFFNNTSIKHKFSIRPLNLFVGLGADYSKGIYFKLPSFIKHSPFNLVFKDLTGKIPQIKKEDISFQLLDFDVV